MVVYFSYVPFSKSTDYSIHELKGQLITGEHTGIGVTFTLWMCCV